MISRPHGVDGTVALTDVITMPMRLGPGSRVGIGFSRDFTRTCTVVSISQNPNRTILRLQEVTDREGAQALADQAVYLDIADVLVAPETRFAIGDITGCTVQVASGYEVDEGDAGPHLLGTITDVLLLPANDAWVVTTPDGKEILLPVIDDVIKHVDVENKVVIVHLIPGLLDPESDDE